jgi:hypothetical protein
VQALDEINAQMQRYLLVQLLASVGVGVATGVVFAMLGLKHAAVWGVVAGRAEPGPLHRVHRRHVRGRLVAFVQFGDIHGLLPSPAARCSSTPSRATCWCPGSPARPAA